MTRHTTPVLDGLAYFGVKIKKIEDDRVWVEAYMETIDGDRYVGHTNVLKENDSLDFGVKRSGIPYDWRKAQ